MCSDVERRTDMCGFEGKINKISVKREKYHSDLMVFTPLKKHEIWELNI